MHSNNGNRLVAVVIVGVSVIGILGIPLLIIGASSHTHWLLVLGLVLLVVVVVEDAVVIPIVRARHTASKSRPR